MTPQLEQRVLGCLIGGAIGDATGLPYEGHLRPRDVRFPASPSISDDTQLTLASCEAILAEGGVSPAAISERLLGWFQAGRVTGFGASTLTALRSLAAGAHWARSGREGAVASEQEGTIEALAEATGTSGYVAESVPFAVGAVELLPRLGFPELLRSVVEAGGDTDTTASMVGQMCGAHLGIENLPAEQVKAVRSIEPVEGIPPTFARFVPDR